METSLKIFLGTYHPSGPLFGGGPPPSAYYLDPHHQNFQNWPPPSSKICWPCHGCNLSSLQNFFASSKARLVSLEIRHFWDWESTIWYLFVIHYHQIIITLEKGWKKQNLQLIYQLLSIQGKNFIWKKLWRPSQGLFWTEEAHLAFIQQTERNFDIFDAQNST